MEKIIVYHNRTINYKTFSIRYKNINIYIHDDAMTRYLYEGNSHYINKV